MRIGIAFPALNMEGTSKNSSLVLTEQLGVTYGRAKVIPANPKTADQVEVRSNLTLTVRTWGTLTAQQREAWKAYAKLYFGKTDDGRSFRASGLTAFTSCNAIRQALGLALISDAPTVAPPSSLRRIAQVPAQNPDAVGIEVTHGIAVTAGLLVLVRATGPMPTPGHTPALTDLRYVCGVGPASAQALPASGTPLVFSPTKYVVQDGQRYGVEARVVRTADGTVSAPVYGDFLKSV